MSTVNDTVNALVGLVTEQAEDRHVVWSKGLGYAQADLSRTQARIGDWVSIEYDQYTHSVTHNPRVIRSNALAEINVLKCQLTFPPSAIFFHYQSGSPCMNVIALRTRVVNRLYIRCLNMSMDVPQSLQDTLLEYRDDEFVVTLHFCDSDDLLPCMMAISPFMVQKGIITALNIEGKGSCEISIGTGTYEVEQHLVEFSESQNRTHLKCGQRITVTTSSSRNSLKTAIFELQVMKNDGIELVYPANAHGVKISFTISPIHDKCWDDKGDCYFMSREEIPVYVGCELPSTSSQILVRASRVTDRSGIFIWRIFEFSMLDQPMRREVFREGHQNNVRLPSQIFAPPYGTSQLEHSSSSSARISQITLNTTQLSLADSLSTEHGNSQTSSRPATSSSKPKTVKKRITFGEESQTNSYIYDDEKQKFSIKNFVMSEDESLRKPLINLSKNPNRSILKKPTSENNLVEQEDFTNESTSGDSPLVNEENPSGSPVREDDDDDCFAVKISTYLKDRDCGCNARWINYIKGVPRPEDIHSETISTEPVFFFSRHTHNHGTRNEFEVWRGFTYTSFPGVIEIIPSTYNVPINVNLGTWVQVSILKIHTKRPPYQSGLMIKHTTVWKYYTREEEIKSKVQNKGHHQWLQMIARLTRMADSNEFYGSNYFGQVYIPAKLLNELEKFPIDSVYSQRYKAWIEPLAKPIRLDYGEVAAWQAISIQLLSEQTLDDQMENMIKCTRRNDPDPNLVLPPGLPKKFREATSKAKRERRKEEARANNQTYIPKEERLDDFKLFIEYLENRDGIPMEIFEDLVLPCQALLDGQEKKKYKVGQIARTIASTFVLSEAGKYIIEGCHYGDKLVKWVVRIIQHNLNYIKFGEGEEVFEKACKRFLDHFDVLTSGSD